MTDKTNIGGMNLSDIEGSDTRVGDVDASVTAQGHIAGRDVIIYNYHYAAQAQVSPPAPTETDADEPLPDNPYRGLFAFRPEHADLFFGREKFTAQLVAAVESRRLVTVLGASGSGKSSVVFAGLVPELVNHPVRQAQGRPGEPWLFTTFRPGDDPFQNLAAALVPLYEETESKTALLGATRDLADSLRAQRYPLNDVLGLIRDSHPDHRLLLIADQFEELYTLCDDAETRQTFLDGLLGLMQATNLPLPAHLVLTLRADFLGQASLYRPFADALQGTTELLGPMTDAELRDAIERPAAVQGVSFEDGLVETLLADVGHEEGSLPLLEFALSELWQHQRQRTLTHTAYGEIGKVEGALSRHADRAYQSLLPAEQQQARRIFVQLVNPGRGTEDTRRLATRTELGQNWALVAKLANERLVVTGSAGDNEGEESEERQDTVEVVHEALIRNWGQLREWMGEDREFLTWLHGLRTDLTRWQAGDGSLLQDTALNVAEEWLAKRPDDLNPAEREYIEAGVARREALEAEKEAQRQALLDAERKQREEAEARQQEQAQAAADLRKRAMWLAVAGGVAVVLAVVAGWFGWQSNKNAVEAENQAAAAVTAQAAAQTAEANAVVDRDKAAEAAAAAETAQADAEAALLETDRQQRATEAELNFAQTVDPDDRTEELLTLLELGRDDVVRKLFWQLPPPPQEDRMQIFTVSDDRLPALAEALLPTMADVNQAGYADPFLTAIAEAAAEFAGSDPQAAAQESFVTNWLLARKAVRSQTDLFGVIEQYDNMLADRPELAALHFERAMVLGQAGEVDAALADLEQVVVLVQDQPEFRADWIADGGSEFYRADQVTLQVRRLLYWLQPDLGDRFEQTHAEYPALAESITPPEYHTDEKTGAQMVLIPAGAFLMGSNRGESDERPQHVVNVPEMFYMDQTEVTNAEYTRCVEAGECEPSTYADNSDFNGGDQPVVGVNWYQAVMFCTWRDGRLPTEAEWERAARSDDGRTYPWGNALPTCDLAQFGGCAGDTIPVGSRLLGISPFGVYDLSGNVWEWTQSEWGDYPYSAEDGRENLDSTDVLRVLRGGGWDFIVNFVRAAYRTSGSNASNLNGNIGLRCIR